MLRKWEKLPDAMRKNAVRPYYDALSRRKTALFAKRVFDVVAGLVSLVILAPVMLITAVVVRLDSPGPALFYQTRVTQYGKQFRIAKFRTMVQNAERMGAQVTGKADARITRVGRTLRKYRIDETPQILNILRGDMSFVGTRPEVPRYVDHYTDEMWATLLLPAGVTSETSILYKDEERLMDGTDDPNRVYVEQILPEKMKYNLDSLMHFSFFHDIGTMLRTIKNVV